jgi:two-component system, NtrC family, response regulator HydG
MAGSDLPSFHGIIGRSAPMRALFRRIARVAPIDVPVLIQGESGTGKELVASAIHRLSRRADRRYEAINCADLTRDLLRSELFGHERGAFSGADRSKVGLVVAADGGSVFLDEVGEVAADAQAMLLRFLQSGEGRAVGATATIRVDVRIIAATHRDLVATGERGAFREDLYYRLQRVVLTVPPLRERREDIPLLVEHVRRQINARYGLAVGGVGKDALDLLLSHTWPGNVRELEAVLEQAMIFKGDGWLRAEEIEFPRGRSVQHVPPRAQIARPAGGGDARQRVRTRRLAALGIVARRGAVTSGKLADECGISGEQARRELVALHRLGKLRREGGGRGTRYVLA